MEAGNLHDREELSVLVVGVLATESVRVYRMPEQVAPENLWSIKSFISIQAASDWLHGLLLEAGARWQSLSR